jgi:hypothetical protein
MPVIRDISYPQQPVGAYEKFEITFQLDATYTNPFDPDDIRVDGHFIYPDGREATVPAFYFIPYESVNGKTLLNYQTNLYRQTGEPAWKIRFASGLEGEYRFHITARDAQGHETRSETAAFRIGPSSSKGFIRISRDNPMYFEHEADGSLFYGSGSNIAWVRSQETKDPAKLSYEYYLNRAKDFSSLTRVWLCHWAWLEWTPNPGVANTYGYAGKTYFNQHIASALDSVFRQAEQMNLKIILTLDDNNELMSGTTYDSWAFHPYNSANGGPAATVEEYWKSREVRELYKKRLRYILARWGYSTSLMTLNAWNDLKNSTPDNVAYLKELRDYAHEVADGFRPVIYGSNIRFEANQVLDYVYAGHDKDRTKPNVTNETHYTRDIEWFQSVLQDQVWDGLATGDAARMVWPHSMVDESGSWTVFQKLLNFVSDIPLNKTIWNPVKAKVVSAVSALKPPYTRVISLEAYGDVPDWGVKSPENEFEVNADENGQWLEGFGRTLYGSNRKEWRNPPTFVFATPANTTAKLLVEVNEVGGGTNTLAVTVNGELVQSVPYCCGRRMLNGDERFVEAPLPAGLSRITLDNAGGDWLRLYKIYILLESDDPGTLLSAKGLGGGDEAFLYLNNQTYGELYRKVLNREAVPLHTVRVDVEGLSDGLYDVAVYDPSSGEYTDHIKAAHENGKFVFAIERIDKDMAVRLVKDTLLAERLLGLIDAYEQDGDLGHPAAMQLKNHLQQALHQSEKGSHDKAAKHMEDFLKHMAHMQEKGEVPEKAAAALKEKAERLIQVWS